MEMTRQEFMGEINKAEQEGKKFNVVSVDCGDVFLSLYDCTISVNEIDGVNGEITFFKPLTRMEVRLDFAIIDEIYNEDGTYRLEFNNGMPDVEITVSEK